MRGKLLAGSPEAFRMESFYTGPPGSARVPDSTRGFLPARNMHQRHVKVGRSVPRL